GKLKSPEERTRAAQMDRKTLLAGGVSCGVILCLASNAQQIGIQYTSVGKAGFITALYIVIVPILGIFLKRRCGWKVWVSVLIALIGFYLLCMVGGFSLERGDVWLLMCAVLFSFHILIIDHFSPMVDGVKMSCIQFFTSGLLSGIAMLVTENPDIANILAAWVPILYAGVLSSGVAYTLQIVGQKNYNPTVATLLLSLESVFSVLTGWVVLHQKLSVRELCGCVLIFIAVILAQLPEREKKGSVECMKPET
ncbi:MAG: DMT family transporter, partial [Lachnospiraceae bacterium]|nr:DMT family transporter [bacterium]MDY5516346.1 DMT family transporter [Lachnospiraceae bacterium]